MKTAIITGASSGLGKEYIKELNRKHAGKSVSADNKTDGSSPLKSGQTAYEIDEIWAIARREDRLLEIKEASNIPVRIFPFDLTDRNEIQNFKAILENEQPDILLLINAAGFGKIGNYNSVSMEECDRMIDLNCRAAVDMTYLCLPYMKAGSGIMEICSTAAFQPFQHLNTYAASKAFLYRFTRALRVELFPRRIKVTAVCPYWIKDTEFIPVAKDVKNSGRAVRHFPFASRVRSVAVWSLIDSRLGLPVSTPGVVCFLHRIAAKFIPAEFMMGIWAFLRRT